MIKELFVRDDEMPPTCINCPCVDETDFPNFFCNVTGDLIDVDEDGERVSPCPLRPLSEVLGGGG